MQITDKPNHSTGLQYAVKPGISLINSVKIVANCHCLPLADAFALCVPGASTDFIDINFAQTPDTKARTAQLEPASAGQIVYTQPISDQFGELATASLRQRLGADGVVTFTNIHFTGMHPDITYLGQMGARLQSFFGDYHSKLVLFCHVSGRSIDDCIRMFTGTTYQKLGYFDAFRLSSNELMAREKGIDIQFAEQFLAMARQAPTLYTVNHPTGSVFLALAEAMATYCDLPFVRFDPAMFQNHLSINYIWPVYDAIAEHNGLAFRSAPYFVARAQRTSRAISLPEFVAGCYAAYTAVGTLPMQQAVAALPFYIAFAEALGV
jgi:hypothetical protein